MLYIHTNLHNLDTFIKIYNIIYWKDKSLISNFFDYMMCFSTFIKAIKKLRELGKIHYFSCLFPHIDNYI